MGKAQGKEVDLTLSDIVNNLSLGKQSDTNTWTYTLENEYTLTITTTNFHSNDNGKPTVAPSPAGNNTLYFTSTAYVSSGTSSRSITITYAFTDANNSVVLGHSYTW